MRHRVRTVLHGPPFRLLPSRHCRAGGLNVWSRIGFKLWGFEAPPVAPLVSKQ
jgi:hypothetical protein